MPVTIDATLDAGSPRVAFSISVDNRAQDHRLRLLFPTGASSVDRARADTAFDVITRPARIPVPAAIRNESPVSSMPMISMADAGDAEVGATVIGKGLMEYEVVGDEPAVAVTLIRAVGDLSRNDLVTRPSGHAGPPVATPGAQCLACSASSLPSSLMVRRRWPASCWPPRAHRTSLPWSRPPGVPAAQVRSRDRSSASIVRQEMWC